MFSGCTVPPDSKQTKLGSSDQEASPSAGKNTRVVLVPCLRMEVCPNDLTQMVNFPTRIPDCDFHSPALLDFLLSSDASICSTKAFPPLGNSDHVVVSVSIDFPSYSQQDAPFHRIAYDYSLAD